MYLPWSAYMLLFVLSFNIIDINIFALANSSFHSLPQPKPQCHDQEKLALLQFKRKFHLDCHFSSSPFAYPKLNSWQESNNQRTNATTNGGDCCKWDGVKCDEKTGHVVGLDLSNSCLVGPFPINANLFGLDHLLELNLACNNFNDSQIPSNIGHLYKLRSLNLSNSGFSGLIPSEISKLSNLLLLDLSFNDDLHCMNLEKLVSNLTRLNQLHLDYVDIRSLVPNILSNRTFLKEITLSSCNLQGYFPAGIFQLPNLEKLSLDSNSGLRGHFSEFQSSSPLKFLNLSSTKFFGTLPTSLGNLDSLNFLDISKCNFSGKIPSSLGNLTNLTYLTLDRNHFSGNLPSSIMNLTQLSTLIMSDVMNVRPRLLKSWLPKLEKLTQLGFVNMNSSREIIPTLRNLTKLTYLNLKDNQISSHFPDNLFANSTQLITLDISGNLLRGQLPIPPSSIQVYKINENHFYGAIPKQICYANSLMYLDLSENFLDGNIPSCIGDPLGGSSLQVSNYTISPAPSQLCKLKFLNLCMNQFEGKLPKSLVNCKMLQVLDVSWNLIRDTFPSWLGSLPKLVVLMLSHNFFHGKIENPTVGRDFHCLHLMDVSSNFLRGDLPSEYFRSSLAMRRPYEELFDYLQPQDYYDDRIFLSICGTSLISYENYRLTITLESSLRTYSKLSNFLQVIDFSNNKFTGKIPEFIGDVIGIASLNLSNNHLVGCIPSSVGNMTILESLDLSHNQLSGMIPQVLAQLTYLEIFNVSHNYLVGQIPQANQFSTFDNSSYGGNTALCGRPLSNLCVAPAFYSCDNIYSLPSLPTDEEDTKLVSWIIISLGCVSGLITGYVLGTIYIADRHHDWFIETFGEKKTRAKKSTPRPRRRRN